MSDGPDDQLAPSEAPRKGRGLFAWLPAARRIRELEAEVRALRESLSSEGGPGALPPEASRTLTELITDFSADLVCVYDDGDRFVYVSPNCDRFFGWKPEHLLGRCRFDLYHEEDRLSLETDAMTDSEMQTRIHLDDKSRFRLRAESGEFRWVEARNRRTRDRKFWVSMIRDIDAEVRADQQRKTMALELRQLAYTDALTGLPNRLAADERLRRASAQAAGNGGAAQDQPRPLSVALIDVDYFKEINDQRGHQAGDRTLKIIGRTLQESKRESDFAARWAGDEFIMLFPDTEAGDAAKALERLCRLVERETAGVTLSVGIAQGDDQHDPDELLRLADRALYTAKDRGRNTVVAHAANTDGQNHPPQGPA